MQRNRYPLFLFLLFISANTLLAQVPKNVMVEHFTNTRCGICSNKNPQFFQNLDNQTADNIFHIAYHPSSPYANCQFSMHNATENDDRTNFYNNYGSTPKLVVQGEKIPLSISFGDPALFPSDPGTSPISIVIEQTKTASSIDASVQITTEVDNTLGEQSIYAGLAEDTVFYASPNGEPEHYNVFRKALTTNSGMGMPYTILGTAGQTSTIDFTSTVHPDWDLERMFVFVIIQDATTKEVIQTQVFDLNDVVSSTKEFNTLKGLSVFPNPVQDLVTIQLQSTKESKIRLFNLIGELILEKTFIEKSELDFSEFPQGAYFLEIENEEGKAIQKLIKE